MLESAQVAAGLLAGSLAGGPAARAQALLAPSQEAAPSRDLPAPPLRDADYWSFADALAPHFDPLWDPARQTYGSGNSSVGRIYHNSSLLTTHAVAALVGHDGPSRQDERARLLAARLCKSPPWSENTSPVEPDPQFHVPGWVESMETTDAPMDKSIDPKVAEALAYAWRARDTLGLSEETVELIRDRIGRCARGPFFRYPNVRLNQINWNAELYAHAATVTGDTELLRSDYRQQVERFANGITQPLLPGGSPNLGPGYRFHYLPQKPPDHGLNLDSAEYANITCHFLLFYEQALRAGMAPLPDEHVRLLRAWVEHIISSYWTHAGYLNWDTGFIVRRWHIGKTWALAQQGLLAIAGTPRFQVAPQLGQWAKYFFDRGLSFYRRLAQAAEDGRGIAPGVLFDIRAHPQGPSQRDLFAARIQANAARAVALGLGRLAAAEPPALYSFDPDIGRLAITTPVYSTAVLPVNQQATPYGGIELARLYDRDQHVLSNPGGRPWASFGVVVRDESARTVLVSQRAHPEPDPLHPPLELLESPGGAVSARDAIPYPQRPYAGRFATLKAIGSASSGEAQVETAHRFRPGWIETRWRIASRQRRRRFTVGALFPTWGREASVEAVLHGGRRRTLAAPGRLRRRVAMRNVAYLYLAGEQGGHVVVPVARPADASAYIVRPPAQASAPRPGPTLVIELARRAKFNRLDLAVRIAPASGQAEAARVARRLRRS